jgi:hypothetical protein
MRLFKLNMAEDIFSSCHGILGNLVAVGPHSPIGYVTLFRFYSLSKQTHS